MWHVQGIGKKPFWLEYNQKESGTKWAWIGKQEPEHRKQCFSNCSMYQKHPQSLLKQISAPPPETLIQQVWSAFAAGLGSTLSFEPSLKDFQALCKGLEFHLKH
jgi:hypothetical protein